MKRLSPNAVNTLRIFTYQQKCIGAALRMGVGDSRLDNASSGGIFAPIDIGTGSVSSGACSYFTPQRYVVHPTSQTIIPGFKVPLWEEAVSMVEKAAMLVQGIPLVGWDVAIMKDKPALVEANAEPEIGLLQIPGRNDLKNILPM